MLLNKNVKFLFIQFLLSFIQSFLVAFISQVKIIYLSKFTNSVMFKSIILSCCKLKLDKVRILEKRIFFNSDLIRTSVVDR